VTVTIDEIRKLVGVQLGIADVPTDSHFVEELGAESSDLLNLVAAVEDRYGISIAEEEIEELQTVADFYRFVRQRTQ
jgi:acyl carrier protein